MWAELEQTSKNEGRETDPLQVVKMATENLASILRVNYISFRIKKLMVSERELHPATCL